MLGADSNIVRSFNVIITYLIGVYSKIVHSCYAVIPYLRGKILIIWSNLLRFTSEHGNWRIVCSFILAILLGFLVIAYFSIDTDTQSPPVPVAPEVSAAEPKPVKNPFLEPGMQRLVLGLVGLIIAILLFVFMYDVGKIRLYAQSLTHRRNVMFAFSLLLLAEIFTIDIEATLGIKTTTPVDITAFAYGILSFFLLYSFVEYCFTFTSDYLRAVADWKQNDNLLSGLAVFVVGVYRTLFDIMLPALAVAYVLTFFLDETENFVKRAKVTIACKHPEIETSPNTSLSVIRESLYNIEITCPECKPIVHDALEAANEVETFTRKTFEGSWFTCDRSVEN